MNLIHFMLVSMKFSIVLGSHFRGAIFTWIPNFNGSSLTISWRISWRRSYSASLYCNDTDISTGSLVVGQGNLMCLSNCTDAIAPLSFICTDYSEENLEDWSTGTNTATYIPTVQQFSFGFTGCCWISTLNVGKDSSWSLLSTVDLTTRKDTGNINTSPTVDLPPILPLQYGCNYSVRLPVADVDGDYIRCRWANGTQECNGICGAFPSEAVLNSTACTLTYQPRQNYGYYAAAIQIEDFVSATSTFPLSSIPLQFLINVYSGRDCNDVPNFVPPTPDDEACFAVDVGEQFSVTITAKNSQPLRRITTLSAVGMIRSRESTYTKSPYFYGQLSVTWVPRQEDSGKDHRLCFYATDTRRITGNIRCVRIPVSVVGPTPLRVERVGISNTWIIIIDKTFSRPTEPAYLHVFETDTNAEIFSVDASTSSDVIFDTDTKQVKVTFNYNFDIDKDYHVTIPSGFVKGHVGCGALSVPVNDSTFWAVEIDCGKLTIANGVTDAPNGTDYPSSVTYRCNIGYDLIGNDTRTCTPNGTWTGEEPFCQIRDCGPFVVPDRVILSTNETVYDTTVTFSCVIGYEPVGSASMYCDHTPAWGSTPPTCVIVDCGDPSLQANGSVNTPNGTTFSMLAHYTCDVGYDLVGTPTRQCQQDKTWSGSQPKCSPKDCGQPTAPANGYISLGSTTFGNTANYSCRSGYLVVGRNKKECLANGSWSYSSPTCAIAGCPVLEAPGNGSLYVSYGNNSELVGTFTCKYAFRMIGRSITWCQVNGSWTSTEPVCSFIDCGVLMPPENGKVLLTGTEFMDNATFSCDTGHDLYGSSFRQCRVTSSWSGAVTKCVPYDCGKPKDPVNGAVVYNETSFGQEAFFSCAEGFYLEGPATINCTVQKSWSSSAPRCLEKDCGELADPGNGLVRYTKTTFKAQAIITCDEGFYLEGPTTVNCTAKGTWSDLSFKCLVKDCGTIPAISHGKAEFNDTKLGAEAVYLCDEGFHLKGPESVHCTTRGTWSDLSSRCLIKDCGEIEHPTNGKAVYKDTTFLAKAFFSCFEGFYLEGPTSASCTANGTWSLPFARCLIKDCGPIKAPTNGKAAYTKTTFRSEAFFTCSDGYFLNGPKTITCTSRGTWSLPYPSCLVKDCGKLEDPDSGKAEFTGTVFGAEALFRCNDGFILKGPATVNCTANGTWSLTPPDCIKREESSNAAVVGAGIGGGLLLFIVVVAAVAAIKAKYFGNVVRKRDYGVYLDDVRRSVANVTAVNFFKRRNTVNFSHLESH